VWIGSAYKQLPYQNSFSNRNFKEALLHLVRHAPERVAGEFIVSDVTCEAGPPVSLICTSICYYYTCTELNTFTDVHY